MHPCTVLQAQPALPGRALGKMSLISRKPHQAHRLSPAGDLRYLLLQPALMLSSTPLLPDWVGMLLAVFAPPGPGGAEGLGRAQAEQRMFVWFP